MLYNESRLQQECVAWFRAYYPKLANVLIHVANEGRRTMKVVPTSTGFRTICVGASRLKAEGMTPGVADLILLHPKGDYGALGIEMKYGKGRQSDNQKLWQACFEKAGNKYVICKSVSSFIIAVNDYLGDEARPVHFLNGKPVPSKLF